MSSTGNRKLSQNGLDLIKSFEGCRLTAYKCLPSEKYYTIGFGHYGSDVTAGMTITEEQAEQYLIYDTTRFVAHVNTYDVSYNFTQNQFDALVSFAYNIGNINQLTQNGTRTCEEIAAAMPLYCNAGGVKVAGLVTRRAKEVELFNTPDSDAVSYSDTGSKESDLTDVVNDVIAGKYGNGSERKEKLTAAGYDYETVQAMVNATLSEPDTENMSDIDTVALLVIRGAYGNGETRKTRLTELGYDYDAVQSRVNEILNGN